MTLAHLAGRKILVLAGHAGSTPGCLLPTPNPGGYKVEAEVTADLARALVATLQTARAAAIYGQGSFSQKRKLSEALSPEVVLELHLNASTNPGAHGYEIWYERDADSLALGRFLHTYLDGLPIEARVPPVKDWLGVPEPDRHDALHHYVAARPCVLLELGFASNDADRAFLTDRANHALIAEKIARGLDAFFSAAGIPLNAGLGAGGGMNESPGADNGPV